MSTHPGPESSRYGRDTEMEEERLHEALLARAQEAMDAAAEVVAHSEVITTVSSDLREGALTSRCAWCSRYRLRDGRWVAIRASVMIELADTTHSICDDCVRVLRDSGLSK
jgi:hypothetical protein